jgi:hypothetical protein
MLFGAFFVWPSLLAGSCPPQAISIVRATAVNTVKIGCFMLVIFIFD